MSFFSNLFSRQNDDAIAPTEAARRVSEGTAILIDVRELDEWEETGVAEPALTLALSTLRAGAKEWTDVLEKNKERDIFLYCHSGGRSDRVASVLRGQGFKAFNIGGFYEWTSAGLPVRKV